MSSWIKRTALAAVATVALMGAASAEVVYNRANSGEPETLDTHKTSTVQEAHILRDMLEGLVDLQRQGRSRSRPGREVGNRRRRQDLSLYLAQWPEMVERRSGEGRRTSSIPIAASWIRRRARNTPTSSIPIKNAEKINKGQGKAEELGVKAVDDKTVEITLEQPTPYFLELLTHQTSLPVHQASVEKFGKDFVKPGNMVTNGAYKLVEFVPNSHIKLAKNENYYDAKNVQIDTVNYFPTPDFAADGAPLRGRRARHHRRRAGRPDEVAQGALQGSGPARPVSRHLVPRRELLQGPVQRREGAPGPLHG